VLLQERNLAEFLLDLLNATGLMPQTT